MTDPTKATRAKIMIGNIEIDGFMLPNGEYRMSQAQSAECIGTTPQNASNFLRSKTFKALKGKESTDQRVDVIEVESSAQTTGGTRINALPLDVVWTFWLYQCSRGNKQAFSLLCALGTESLERRFDSAFGVSRSEEERNQRLSQKIQQLESDMVEAYAIEDDIRRERDYFERLLRDNGIDPYGLPENE